MVQLFLKIMLVFLFLHYFSFKFIPYFWPKLYFRYTVQENSFIIYNAYNQVCFRYISNNHVIIYILIQSSSIYVASSLSYIQYSISAYLYMKIRHLY